MDFAHLLYKDYAATVEVEKPDNLCQHRCTFVKNSLTRRNIFLLRL